MVTDGRNSHRLLNILCNIILGLVVAILLWVIINTLFRKKLFYQVLHSLTMYVYFNREKCIPTHLNTLQNFFKINIIEHFS